MNRRASMKRALPHDLTSDKWEILLEEKFDGKCMFTGKKKHVSLEHFIPLSIGWGGTTETNCIPMLSELNESKASENPYKWVKRQNADVQRAFYEVVVPYMAELNGMDTKTYKKFVNFCFKNPRKPKEVRADYKAGKTDKDLFYEWLEKEEAKWK